MQRTRRTGMRWALVTASVMLTAGVIGLAPNTQAQAAVAACKNPPNFDRWLQELRRDAVAQGIAPRAVEATLQGVTFDPQVVRRDQGQAVFQQSFLQFAGRMTGGGRHPNGLKQLKANAGLFKRIEERFGVPPVVVAALWGLESDYGAYKGGKFQIVRSVATLAFDCRRSDFFRQQLLDAIRIVQRGDLRPDEMIGNWAGELGPTQFTPSDYFKHGVDFDGDGRVDMIRSVPDALASAANLMKNFGWQRGQPWLEEVRVPQQMKWEEADLAIQHPRSQWIQWGVRAAPGNLPSDNMPASLVLPMGRHGPAFLAYPNFHVFLEWNQSLVY